MEPPGDSVWVIKTMLHTWAADGCSKLWQAPSKSMRYNSYVPRWFWYLRLVDDTNYLVNYIQLEIYPSLPWDWSINYRGKQSVEPGVIIDKWWSTDGLFATLLPTLFSFIHWDLWGIIIIIRNPDIGNQGITAFTKRLNDAGATMGTLGRASPWQSSWRAAGQALFSGQSVAQVVEK